MTVQKPPVTYIGTNGQNIWTGKGLPKVAIVCHIMEGTLAGCDSWFSNPAAQASSNYGIGKDGTIHCYVDPESKDAPFANGLVNKPDAAFLTLAKAYPENPNYWTISIEHEGNSGDPMPPAQLAASAALAAWLCDRFGIPADDAHLLGHYEIDSVTRAGCPGWNHATWLTWEAAVLNALTPQPQPTPPDPRIAQALAALTPVATAVQQAIHVLSNPPAVLADAFQPGAPGEAA